MPRPSIKIINAITTHCRQAITTAFHGPTDRLDPRVTARCDAGRLTVLWDDALDLKQNHAAAAYALADKLGWLDRDRLVMGGTRDGFVFTLAPRR